MGKNRDQGYFTNMKIPKCLNCNCVRVQKSRQASLPHRCASGALEPDSPGCNGGSVTQQWETPGKHLHLSFPSVMWEFNSV